MYNDAATRHQGSPLYKTRGVTRAIAQDKNIEGVTINGVAHKISQYADDSILIARIRDWARMKYHLGRWCAATAMRENTAALAEPIFYNWRFEADASDEEAQEWSRYIGLKTLMQ